MGKYISSGSYTLDHVLEEVHEGRLGKPNWCRGYVWEEEDAVGLLDSLYRGYPIGSFIFSRPGDEVQRFGFWRPGEEDRLWRVIGLDEKNHAVPLVIVDGYQRIATLYRAMRGIPLLTGDGSLRAIMVVLAFRPRDGLFRIANEQVHQDPEYLPDISVVVNGEWSRETDKFLDRLRSVREVHPDEEDAVYLALQRLRAIANSSVPVYELDSSYAERDALDVYLRVHRRCGQQPEHRQAKRRPLGMR